MLAYQQAHRVQFQPWEFDAVLAMDATWLGAQKPPSPDDQPKVEELPKLTPALFRSMTEPPA